MQMSGDIYRKKKESLNIEMSLDNDQKQRRIKTTVSSSKIVFQLSLSKNFQFFQLPAC